MDIKVFPSEIWGTLRAPSSKSMAIRATAAAMLSSGTSQIFYPSQCDDALAMSAIARQAGAQILEFPDKLEITGGVSAFQKTINCGESGLAARLMIAIAALFENESEITGEGTLLNRHLGNITETLSSLGATCKTTDGKLPFRVRGPLNSGTVEVDGSGGSQFISGLLMALPLAKNDTQLKVLNLKSIPYIDMTLDMLNKFGIEIQHQDYKTFQIKGKQTYRPANLEIEGDWSGAAFLLVASAIAGNLKITGLDIHSHQADIKILEALAEAGLKINNGHEGFRIKKSHAQAFNFDATHCPDLFPPLVVLAASASGLSHISGVSRLSQKESNRGLVLQQEMKKLGITIDLFGD
ncbi:MAG: 3-phosphoshikimate 1-carboxyvinyltransferase, partial [Bacteroidales bacterium]|nr:3-phosphoshikimate 1-carboxyvinyltransferase [Bacteroidales bacterium]